VVASDRGTDHVSDPRRGAQKNENVGINLVSACGPQPNFDVCFACERLREQSRTRAGCSASPRRSPLRVDCPALLGRVACRQTHCAHFVRCVQTNGDKSVVDARCARGHTPCDARRLRGAAQPARARLCSHRGVFSANSNTRGLRGRCCPAGAIWVATSRRARTETVQWTVSAWRAAGPLARRGLHRPGPGSARAQRAPQQLTRRGCSSAANEVSVASSAARPRTEQRSEVGAQHRPPPYEPPAGSACRDARTMHASGRSRTSARGRKPSHPHNSRLRASLQSSSPIEAASSSCRARRA